MARHVCSKSGLPMHLWIVGQCPGCMAEGEAAKRPDPFEMQAALARCGVEWDADFESPEFYTWAVTGLENGGESADSCEAAIRRMMDAAQYDGAREERERLREHLAEHYLAEMRCDHEAGTDVAICSCGLWASEPQPSVGEAVREWADHALAEATGGAP
jgi:hypothetical protein